MKLAINAIVTHPGGGMTVLVGLLEAWRTYVDRLEIVVYAIDPRTIDAVRATGWTDCRMPNDVGHSTSRQYMWQNYRLGQELKQSGADLLLTNNHYIYNIPCAQIVHHHNAWRFITKDELVERKSSLSNWVRDFTARKALRSATANVFVSDFLRRRAEHFVPSSAPRNYVIPNALPDRFVDQSKRLAFNANPPPQILVLQSADPHKDNPTAIRMMAELARRDPAVPWRLKLAGGDGRGSQQSIRALAKELGVEDRITWCGFCSQDQIDALSRESLCLVCTSILEAGPLPVIESMARRCVPIAARIPAVEDFVGDSGVLVEPFQADQFAEAAMRLYRHPEERRALSDRGVQRVQSFRWADRAARFMELFEKIARH